MRFWSGAGMAAIASVMSTATAAQNASIAYYYDARTYPTVGVTTAWNELPLRFSFWGFTDLHGTQRAGSVLEITRYFMEYRLTFDGGNGFGVQGEFNDFAGAGNSMARLGLTYRHRLPFESYAGWLQWRFFPIETNGGGQGSLIVSFPVTSRLHLSGFADVNWEPYGWVIEPQLSYRITNDYALLLEFRHNGFESGTLQSTGIALGFRLAL